MGTAIPRSLLPLSTTTHTLLQQTWKQHLQTDQNDSWTQTAIRFNHSWCYVNCCSFLYTAREIKCHMVSLLDRKDKTTITRMVWHGIPCLDGSGKRN